MYIDKWSYGFSWTCECGNYTTARICSLDDYSDAPGCCRACGRLGRFMTKRVGRMVYETPSFWEMWRKGMRKREYLEEPPLPDPTSPSRIWENRR